MTISSENRKAGPFAGSGSAGPFSFTFKVFQASDVLVVKFNTTTNVEQTLTLTADYTVSLNSDQNVAPGGTVTLTSVLASGFNLALSSQVQSTQETDLTNQGGFYPEVITAALDKLTIVNQQNDEALSRSVKTSLADTRTGDELRDDLFAAQVASAASAAAASSSQSAALASQTAAATSETNAATSAAAAAAAAASGLYSAVQDKSADYTVVLADAGDLFRVTTTASPVTITLPDIAAPMLDGFKVAVAKFTNDANVVSVTSATGELINGSSIYALDALYEMATFVADLETQTWFAVGNGTNISSAIVETFNGTNGQTVFTLTNDPGIANAVDIFINGVYQQKSQFTIVGTTLTFTEAPPRGTANIEARYALPIPIGTPSNNTVSTAKIVDSAVTATKIAVNSVDGTKINLTSNSVGDLMYYNGTDWVRFPRPLGGASNLVLKHGWNFSSPSWTQGAYLEQITLDNVSGYQYSIPVGFRFARVYIFGAGGGGGSGQWQQTVATACGGGGGGGAGALGIMEFSVDAGTPPLFTFSGGNRGIGGVGSLINGTPGTAGTAGTALTVTISDVNNYSTGTSFTIAPGLGGAAGSATGGAGGAGGAAPANTAPQSFLLTAAGLGGGAGTLGATGTVGVLATALLQPPGGGGGAGLAAGGNVSFVGGNSSTTWIGHNRTLRYDQAAGSSSGDGVLGGSGPVVSGHLGMICAAGNGGGNSGTTAASNIGDGGTTYGYGCGGGGGGGTRNAFQNRGSNGGDGSPAMMIVLCW